MSNELNFTSIIRESTDRIYSFAFCSTFLAVLFMVVMRLGRDFFLQLSWFIQINFIIIVFSVIFSLAAFILTVNKQMAMRRCPEKGAKRIRLSSFYSGHCQAVIFIAYVIFTVLAFLGLINIVHFSIAESEYLGRYIWRLLPPWLGFFIMAILIMGEILKLFRAMVDNLAKGDYGN